MSLVVIRCVRAKPKPRLCIYHAGLSVGPDRDLHRNMFLDHIAWLLQHPRFRHRVDHGAYERTHFHEIAGGGAGENNLSVFRSSHFDGKVATLEGWPVPTAGGVLDQLAGIGYGRLVLKRRIVEAEHEDAGTELSRFAIDAATRCHLVARFT